MDEKEKNLFYYMGILMSGVALLLSFQNAPEAQQMSAVMIRAAEGIQPFIEEQKNIHPTVFGGN